MKARRGFLSLDVAIALGMAVILAITLASAVGKQRLAAAKLSDLRQATRLAEETLTSLQMGTKPPAGMEGAKVSKKNLGESNDAPGFVWVEVTAAWHGRPVEMTGLVPRGNAPKAAP
ncbi:MAG TPA: hypothetical protein VIL86_18305 [Tepidisphaeraceae bacterium]|jgi:hypothetical protein